MTGMTRGGWVIIDALIGVLMLVLVFWSVALFAVRERQIVEQVRRTSAMEALAVEQLERLKAGQIASLKIGRDQAVEVSGLDDRLMRDVTCRFDVEPYRPDHRDLLKLTVRVIWMPGNRDVKVPLVRSLSTLVARRRCEGDR